MQRWSFEADVIPARAQRREPRGRPACPREVIPSSDLMAGANRRSLLRNPRGVRDRARGRAGALIRG